MIHRKPAAVTLALASLLGLTACGGDNSNSSAPVLTVGEGQTSIAATGTAPADKDTLVIVMAPKPVLLIRKNLKTPSALPSFAKCSMAWFQLMPRVKPSLVWQKNGKLRTIKFGHSPCAMPNGQTVIRSQLMMQYMPCTAW